MRDTGGKLMSCSNPRGFPSGPRKPPTYYFVLLLPHRAAEGEGEFGPTLFYKKRTK